MGGVGAEIEGRPSEEKTAPPASSALCSDAMVVLKTENRRRECEGVLQDFSLLMHIHITSLFLLQLQALFLPAIFKARFWRANQTAADNNDS